MLYFTKPTVDHSYLYKINRDQVPSSWSDARLVQEGSGSTLRFVQTNLQLQTTSNKPQTLNKQTLTANMSKTNCQLKKTSTWERIWSTFFGNFFFFLQNFTIFEFKKGQNSIRNLLANSNLVNFNKMLYFTKLTVEHSSLYIRSIEASS